MTIPFACIPVCTMLTALGLLFFLVMTFGLYNRSEAEAKAAAEAPAAWEFNHLWAIAIAITIVIPTLMLLGIWLLPDW